MDLNFDSPKSNSNISNIDQIIKACVAPADFNIAKILIEFDASDVDKLVKVRPGSKQNLKKALAYLKQQQKIGETYQIKNSFNTNFPKTVQELMQKINKLNKNELQDYDSFEMVTYSEQIILNELKGNLPQQQIQETLDMLYHQVQKILQFQECEKKDQLVSDIKNGKLIKYENYEWENQKKFKIFLKRFQSLPLYQTYKKYFRRNLKTLKQVLKLKIRQKLLQENSKFTPKQIKHVEQFILKNPLDNFMIRKQLNEEQKQFLYKQCWQKHFLIDFAEVYYKPQSLDQQVEQILETIMDYIIQTGKINEKQYNEARQAVRAVKNFSSQQFYMIPSIANHRKIIYEEFIKKAGPYYFYRNQLNKNICKSQTKIKFCIQLRKFIHQTKINSFLYNNIEECLLNDNVIQLWKIPLLNEQREKLVQFYFNQQICQKYNKLINRLIPLRIEAEAELQRIAIKCDFKNLTFDNIKNAIPIFLNNKMLHGFELNSKQQKDFMQHYQKSSYAKKYIQYQKIDQQQLKYQLRQKILYIISKIPNSITYETIENVISNILNICDLGVLNDLQDLTTHQKIYINSQLLKSQQYKQYQCIFQKIKAIKAKQYFKQYLTKFFNSNSNIILNYYLLYGQITLDNEGKIYDNLTLKNIPENILKDKSQIIKQIQQNQIYKEFKKYFDILFLLKKKQTQIKLLSLISNILQQYNLPLQNYIQQIDNNQFDFQKFPNQLKQRIKVQFIYNQIMAMKDAKARTKKLRNYMKLKRFIQSLKYHQVLHNYSIEQRNQVIDGIINKDGLIFIQKTDILRLKQKKAIQQLIINTNQWKLYNQYNLQNEQQESIPNFTSFSPIKIQPQSPSTKQLINKQIINSDSPMKPNNQIKQNQNTILNNLTQQDSCQSLTKKLIQLLKNVPGYPANCKQDKIMKNINANIYENEEKLKTFLKNIGFGVVKIPKALSYLQQNKQMIMKIISKLSQLNLLPLASSQTQIINLQKVQNELERQCQTQIIKVSSIKTQENQQLSNSNINDPINKFILLLKGCSAFTINISKDKLNKQMNPNIFDDLQGFLKSIGVIVHPKRVEIAKYMQENKEKFVSILQQIQKQ